MNIHRILFALAILAPLWIRAEVKFVYLLEPDTNSASGLSLNAVASGATTALAVGRSNNVFQLSVPLANEPIQVSKVPAAATNNLYSVAFDGVQRIYVAGGSSGSFFGGFEPLTTSASSGNSWSPINTLLPATIVTNNPILGLATLGGSFLAAPEEQVVFRSAKNSPLGSRWLITSNADTTLFRVFRAITAVSDNVALLVGDSELVRATSDSGETWRQVRLYQNPETLERGTNLFGVASHEKQVVAVGEAGFSLVNPDFFANPTNWTLSRVTTNATLLGITWAGNQYVTVGTDGRVLLSTNGTSWDAANLGSISAVDFNAVSYSSNGPLAGLTFVVGASNVIVVGGELPAAPTLDPPSQTDCFSPAGAVYSVKAINLPPNVTVDWYASSNNVDLLLSNTNTYTWRNPSPTNYVVWAQARDSRIKNDGGTNSIMNIVSTSRTPATLLINPLPPVAVVDRSSQTNCFEPEGALNSVTVINVAVGAAVDWYSSETGGVPVLANNATYTWTNSLPGSHTVWAGTRFTGTGCVSSNRTPATLLINPLPPVAVVDKSTQTNCFEPEGALNSVTVINVAVGAAVDWYSSETGGVPVLANNATYTWTNSLPGSHTVWAGTRFTGTGCVSSNRTPATVIINPLPPVAVVDKSSQTNCFEPEGGLNTVTVINVAVGAAVDWYSSETGGAPVLSNNATYTWSNSLPGSYTVWAETRFIGTGCASSNRTSATLIINPLPPVAVVDRSSQTNCFEPEGALNSVTVINVAVGAAVDWYSSETGGAPDLANSATYTWTNSLPGSHTVWAETRFTGTGCVSSNRTPATLIINPLPPVAVVDRSSQTNCFESEGALYLVTVSNVAAGSVVDWYSSEMGGTPLVSNNATYTWTNSLPGSYSVWAETRFTGTGCVSSNRTPATLVINLLPTVPVVDKPTQTTCYEPGGALYSVTVNNVAAGAVVDWYLTETGGAPVVANSVTYTWTNPPPASYTIWAQMGSAGTGCVSSNRTPATLVVNPLPAVAVVNLPAQTNCFDPGGALYSVTVTNVAADVVVNWYASQTGQAPVLANNATYTWTDPSSGRYEVWAETRFGSTGCISSNRTLVTLTINALPVVNLKPDAVTNYFVGQEAVQLASLFDVASGVSLGSFNFTSSSACLGAGGIFTPTTNCLGTNVINYTYTDGSLCEVSGSFNLQVFDLLVGLVVDDLGASVALEWFSPGELQISTDSTFSGATSRRGTIWLKMETGPSRKVKIPVTNEIQYFRIVRP